MHSFTPDCDPATFAVIKKKMTDARQTGAFKKALAEWREKNAKPKP